MTWLDNHQLWRIEKSFRMSKHDLQARPVYHQLVECLEGIVVCSHDL
jgi:hypothetical protein